MGNVKLEWVTPDAEKLVAYIARVSSPKQANPEYEGLIKFLIRNKHWSPFEMVSACFELEVPRAIAHQITRHRSFSYQEFSQRYSSNFNGFYYPKARMQGEKNRQGSSELEVPADVAEWWDNFATESIERAQEIYTQGVNMGIAKEVARFVLPEATMSKLYMAGTLRSWIHYVELRTTEHTQQEHREIALAIKGVLKPIFPIIFKALEW